MKYLLFSFSIALLVTSSFSKAESAAGSGKKNEKRTSAVANSQKHQQSKLKSEVPGILLPGPSNKPAESAMKDYAANLSPEDLETSEQGGDIKYTKQFKVCIRKGATIGQVNATLKSARSRIVGMFDGDTCPTIMVPPGVSPPPEGDAFLIVREIFVPLPN